MKSNIIFVSFLSLIIFFGLGILYEVPILIFSLVSLILMLIIIITLNIK